MVNFTYNESGETITGLSTTLTTLTDLVIPKKNPNNNVDITTIDANAFSAQHYIKSVSFASGTSVTSIGDNAFANCNNLKNNPL